PEQIEPMLLTDWQDLDPEESTCLENDHHDWCVQPKLDGVRMLLHVETNQVRLTGRTVSDLTYRLSEHQNNVPHLIQGLDPIPGPTLDGKLPSQRKQIDTATPATETALQAVVAILATSPENAVRIQAEQDARLELHVFDVLQWRGEDVTTEPLVDRLKLA